MSEQQTSRRQRALHGRTRPGGRLHALDGLRLVAALAAVLYHLTARYNPGVDGQPAETFPGLVAITRWGSVGVQLFFVISGFVILLTAWRADLPSFAASRLSRLFPAYWASVLLNAVLFGLVWRAGYAFLHDGQRVTVEQVLANLTMVQEPLGQPGIATSYWTLWPEILFYLGMAVLIGRGITTNRVLGIAFCWPLLSLVTQRVPLLETLMITQWSPFFAGGMALYLIYRNGHGLLPWLVVGFNAVLGIRVVVAFQSGVMPAGTGIGSDPWIAGVLAALCFVAVALVTVTPLARIRGRWLAVAGALTYPLYLTHEAVGWFTIRQLHGPLNAWQALAAAVLAALVVAAVIHVLVERPLAGRMRAAVLGWLRRGQQAAVDSRSESAGRDRSEGTAPAEAAVVAGAVLSGATVPSPGRADSLAWIAEALSSSGTESAGLPAASTGDPAVTGFPAPTVARSSAWVVGEGGQPPASDPLGDDSDWPGPGGGGQSSEVVPSPAGPGTESTAGAGAVGLMPWFTPPQGVPRANSSPSGQHTAEVATAFYDPSHAADSSVAALLASGDTAEAFRVACAAAGLPDPTSELLLDERQTRGHDVTPVASAAQMLLDERPTDDPGRLAWAATGIDEASAWESACAHSSVSVGPLDGSDVTPDLPGDALTWQHDTDPLLPTSWPQTRDGVGDGASRGDLPPWPSLREAS